MAHPCSVERLRWLPAPPVVSVWHRHRVGAARCRYRAERLLADAAEIERIRTELETEFGVRVVHDASRSFRGEQCAHDRSRRCDDGTHRYLGTTRASSTHRVDRGIPGREMGRDPGAEPVGGVHATAAALPHMKQQAPAASSTRRCTGWLAR